MLLALCWLPLYLLTRPLPDASDPPFDIIWFSEYTHKIANGVSPFVIMDPYLRYIIYVIPVWVIERFRNLSINDVIWLNAQITLLLEGLAIPCVLYWVTRRWASRRAALGSLGILALIQTHRYIWHPGLGFVADSWYLSPHWQYAIPVIPVLLAFYFTSSTALDRYQYTVVYAGFFLGVAAGIQVIQATIASIIIAAALIWTRRWRDLGVIVGVSMLVASPNILIMRQYLDKWLAMGVSRLHPDRLLALISSPLVLAVVLCSCIAVGAVFLRGPEHVPIERVTPLSWAVVSGGVVVFCSIGGLEWYQWQAATLFKYAVTYWAGYCLAILWAQLEVAFPHES